MPTTASLLEQLVCLNCRQVLSHQAEQYECPGCGQVYPVIDNTPVILPAKSKIVHANVQEKSYGLSGLIKRIEARIQNSKTLGQMVTVNTKNMRFLRANLEAGQTVLLAGGGIREHGEGIELLGPELLANTVNLDVEPGPVVNVVADAHDIPFPDHTFDLVISQAVLEHVRDPHFMVSELARILKPGGWILVDVPFLWPIHMRSDFFRYTPMGLAELLHEFEAVKTGTNAGLASATALINTQFWATLLSFGNPRLYRMLCLVLRPLTEPVKYFDLMFRRWNLPTMAPASTFFIGRKAVAPTGSEE